MFMISCSALSTNQKPIIMLQYYLIKISCLHSYFFVMANLTFFEMKFGDYSSFFQRKEKLYSSNNVDLKDLL